MRTSPHIGHSHLEQMKLIYEFICRFDVYNLLYAINGKQLDEDEIISLTLGIKDYNAKLSRQKHYLFRFCKSFAKEFAHEDNNLVDSSVKVTWRMRSGVACVKKVFKRFCKVSRKQLPAGTPDPQAIDRSLICSRNYQCELYGLSSYPECVKELFCEMLEFYTNLNECLEEGLRALKEEQQTKGDAHKCYEILKKSCEKSREAQSHFIDAIQSDPELLKMVMANKTLSGDDENPVLKDYKRNTMSKEQFAQRYYHNCSPKDVGKITIYDAYSEVSADPSLGFAKVVFGNDEPRIQQINYVIEHFDELLPEKCKRGKIPAANLLFFYEWCRPLVGFESFLNYFNRHYVEHGGKWGTIGKSALSGAQTKDTVCKDGSFKKERTRMLDKLALLLSQKFPEAGTAS